jgi:tRNA threonylcarbamoyladenosine biosynthesis protein TsaB
VILAVDTSTDVASVAIVGEDGLFAEMSWHIRNQHSRHLDTVLRTLFSATGTSVIDLTAVVAANGPGSFSGIRVGISAAKGLAMSRGIPLVGICTLDVIGFQAARQGREVWAILPAGRQQLYLARYRNEGIAWQRIVDPHLIAAEDLRRDLTTGCYLAGEGILSLCPENEDLSTQLPHEAPRRAAFLAELGRRYFSGGGVNQLDTLEPLYLRLSSAEEKRKAETSN